MNKIVAIILLGITLQVCSQTKVPQLVSFSAVVRNANNTPLANTPVSLRLTFRKLGQTGPVVYCALHQQTTNANGYITLQLNRQVLGTACNGAPSTAFENIPWEEGGFWMDVEYQTTPTSPFVSLGQLELASTFYSFVSKYAENVKGLSLGAANNDDVLAYESTSSSWKAKPMSSTVGPQGPAGAQGPQGIAGPAGNNGVSITNTQILNDSLKITLSNNTIINAGYVKGDTGVQGPAGKLQNGTNTGNTPNWDGTQWIINNSNIYNNGAGIGFGTTAPNASAKLEIASTTQGFLPPRMTTAQRNVISLPSAGLTIFNTTENCLQWWNGNVWFDGCGNNPHLQYPAGSVFCASGATAVVDVTNPATGKTWMDRNLGASRVAISSTDTAAYGDLYQWGRRSDGHQCRNSSTTSTLSSTDKPVNSSFILTTSSPNDWRSPQNSNLWQGVNGVNNPCPNGYRLPTETELNAERINWGQNNSSGAYVSPLKFLMAGYRLNSIGSLAQVGFEGFYQSSTVMSTNSRILRFSNSIAILTSSLQAIGFSVRCIKDTSANSAIIGSLNCGSSTNSSSMMVGTSVSNLTISVPYYGANGGAYNGQAISSTGVTGLTATLSAGTLLNGNGSISYTITGTPTSSGTAYFNINIGGKTCSLSLSVGLAATYASGSVFCSSGTTAVVEVTNPATGRTWMDRNLGAPRAAISSTDTVAYGDLYQWGRRSDGHQCRNSNTTSTFSSTDQPAHGSFILTTSSPNDWRSPQNSNLWQGVNGVNNPCPNGYRLPTESELNAERSSWGQNNSSGAYVSPLKFLMAGYRLNSIGSLAQVGFEGYYQSSTVISPNSRVLRFSNTIASLNNSLPAVGFSVRCIKDIVGIVSAINCGSTTNTGTLTAGTAASGVSSSVPYTGGNGGSYNPQSVSSTGVTGLTANLSAGNLLNGNGSVSYTITGTPLASGTASFFINLGGQSCSFTINVASSYPVGSVFCASGAAAVVNVTNPTTGKIWMDRNLGASRVAISSTDNLAYGDLYQWGRRSDGHQCRNSSTTSTLSSLDQPAHGNFILIGTGNFDWRSPQNSNLWQGVNGVNNPCPIGYRLPTETELNAERLSWALNNSSGAFFSNLKLPSSGYRDVSNGSLTNLGTSSSCWSSTVNGTNSSYLYFNSSNTGLYSYHRGLGFPVRCLKD